jgi:hypothetical protein
MDTCCSLVLLEILDLTSSVPEQALRADGNEFLQVSLALLLLCPTHPPTHRHHPLLQALLQNLASGLTVAEAAWQAGQQLTGMELEHIRSHIIVMGAPTLTASIGGSRGGKGGAAGAKKK